MANPKKYLASLLSVALVFVVIFYIVTMAKPKVELVTENDNDPLEIAPHVQEIKKLEQTGITTVNRPTQRDSIVHFGLSLLGTPYVAAGCSTSGFDCSGFVFFVFKNFGVDVPRSSSLFKDFGETVNINDVQKGDVLVFLSSTRDEIGHIGIVTKPKGMETEFVHSSSGKAMAVIISSLKNEGYKKRFVKTVDVLGDR